MFIRKLFVAFVLLISASAFAQQSVTKGPYMVNLETDSKAIPTGKEAMLDVFVMDANTMAPVEGLTITPSLTMPSMTGMMLEKPKVMPGSQPGHYNIMATFPHAGGYRLA